MVGDSTAVGTGASTSADSVAGLIGRMHPNLRIVNRAGMRADHRPGHSLAALLGDLATIIVRDTGRTAQAGPVSKCQE